MTCWTFCRKYLSDPTEDVQAATINLLADFLREIRNVSIVRRQLDEQAKAQTPFESLRQVDIQEKLPELTLDTSEKAVFISDNEYQSSYDSESALKDDYASTSNNDRDTGGMLLRWCTRRLETDSAMSQLGYLVKE